jgi:YidC/Oxa1 family membrane protein insertase
MDNIRLFLWLAIGLMVWLNYEAWVKDYPPPAPSQATAPQTAPASVPDLNLPALPDAAPQEAPGADLPAPLPAVEPTVEPTVETVRVRTDVMEAEISLNGGDLVRVELTRYPRQKDQPDVPVRLLDYEPGERFLIQTGLRTSAGGVEPNHLATYQADQTAYVLSEGQDTLSVPLRWVAAGQVLASKVFTFRRGGYQIDLDLVVENQGTEPVSGAPYAQLLRRHQPVERSFTSVESYSYRGPVLFDGEKYDKLDVEELAENAVTAVLTGGWLASIQHHFLAAVVPATDQSVQYQASARADQYLMSAVTPLRTVAAGETARFPFTLFVGPKLQDQLEAAAPGLKLTVDYGVLTLLAQPLFWLLSRVHDLVGNWGWAIVLVTVLIKLAFYKLTATSGRSMAKMRKLQPRIKALQDRYKEDRQALGQAMMDLYKREKVNPAAGCLPILIQMPFFFAFYWVLIEGVEMRQAPFMLWITDLSVRDPFFVLPLLNGAAMFFQQRLSPAPPDPVQAKVMQFMPVVFSVMFAFFPAGLVLYWLTNASLSILQQWRINKVVGAD